MSLEREVDEMINDMMKKEGWSRSQVLRTLKSKFESEERNQEIAYINKLLKTEVYNNDDVDNDNYSHFQKDY
jgi:hypothetical protein